MRRISTLEDLRDRCVIDDITGCWLWRGGLYADGSAGVNVILPGQDRTRTVRGRRAALFLATGEDLKPGHRAWARHCCTEPSCCNPDHAKRGTAKQWGADMSATGKLNTLARKAAEARRGRERRKLTDEQAAQIRNDPRGPVEVSKCFGVPRSAVQRIRAGETYRDTLPAASVFSWRPIPPQDHQPARRTKSRASTSSAGTTRPARTAIQRVASNDEGSIAA